MTTNTLGLAPTIDEQVLPFALPLELHVTDPELVQELVAHTEGKPRSVGERGGTMP